MNYKQRQIFSEISQSRGRFFGLRTKQGGIYNAQFLSASPYYLRFFDRNARRVRKIAKTSLAGIKLGAVSL